MSAAAQLFYHSSNSTSKPTDTALRGLLIDTAVPDDTDVNTKSCNVESEGKIVPVLSAALGKIKKGLDQNLQLLAGHPWATELQKVTLMGTAHSLR